ncbi:MAG: NAD(P)H-hydrate dehydratase [Oscillospiraceae bacterium]|nr:NAD(P)H-hydrate dehydratase [Oscillospiraceae bacterium]
METYICTPAQMRAAETDASGGSDEGLLTLMENAGRAFADEIRERAPDAKDVLILCGKGNNGGDGFVAARLLSNEMNVTVALLVNSAPTGIAGTEFSLLQNSSVKIISGDETDTEKEYDVIADAVFGTGFHGELPENVSLIFSRLMYSKALKISADVPSGVNAENAIISRCVFPADVTVTFGAVKLGMTLSPARDMCGEIVVREIGVEEALKKVGFVPEMMTERKALSVLPERNEFSHKGNFGRLTVIGGSSSMSGAAALNVKAALRCGAGLVRLASVKTVCDRVASGIYECTFAELITGENGNISSASLDLIEKELMCSDTAAIGSGLGCTADTSLIVREVIRICGKNNIPLVIDADGLNCLAADGTSQNVGFIAKHGCHAVLTPHPKELARLLGEELKDVLSDRLGAAVRLSTASGSVVVSKGYPTFIVSPDGRAAASYTGNAGLSKGGSGDVLTGIISGLLTSNKGDRLFDCACGGVWIFGAAADITAERSSMTSMLPSDVTDDLDKIFHKKDVI